MASKAGCGGAAILPNERVGNRKGETQLTFLERRRKLKYLLFVCASMAGGANQMRKLMINAAKHYLTIPQCINYTPKELRLVTW